MLSSRGWMPVGWVMWWWLPRLPILPVHNHLRCPPPITSPLKQDLLHVCIITPPNTTSDLSSFAISSSCNKSSSVFNFTPNQPPCH